MFLKNEREEREETKRNIASLIIKTERASESERFFFFAFREKEDVRRESERF